MSHFPTGAHHKGREDSLLSVVALENLLSDSDAELVQRTRRGDRSAFAGLVERYEQPALLLARSILHSWHDARDAVQDAFVAAYERLNKLWSPEKFGAWFLQIVRRHALWQLRRRTSQTRSLVSAGVRQISSSDTDDRLSIDFSAMIARLPLQECVVVTLRHLNELSVGEIAEITGRPVGTVTKQLSRAYSRMRPWIAAER